MIIEYIVIVVAVALGLYLAFGAFEVLVFNYAARYWHDKAYAAQRGLITHEAEPWYVRYSRRRTAAELNEIADRYLSPEERLEKEYGETSEIDVVSRREV